MLLSTDLICSSESNNRSLLRLVPALYDGFLYASSSLATLSISEGPSFDSSYCPFVEKKALATPLIASCPKCDTQKFVLLSAISCFAIDTAWLDVAVCVFISPADRSRSEKTELLVSTG
jgi:hypothetical protein